MTTQLRLVDPPARTGRRAVRWPEWRLDPRTRSIGRRGVARARAELERASRPDPGAPLPKAS
ncbi:MAG: hypothetical protein ACRDZ1_17015 [Acidimicrobiia bacterium]